MKDSKQIAESVFRKSEERIQEKMRRAAFIRRNTIIASGLCAVLIAGFGIWKNNDIRNALHRNQKSHEIPVITETDITTANSETIITTSAVITSKSPQTAVSSKKITSSTQAVSAVSEQHSTTSVSTEKNTTASETDAASNNHQSESSESTAPTHTSTVSASFQTTNSTNKTTASTSKTTTHTSKTTTAVHTTSQHFSSTTNKSPESSLIITTTTARTTVLKTSATHHFATTTTIASTKLQTTAKRTTFTTSEYIPHFTTTVARTENYPQYATTNAPIPDTTTQATTFYAECTTTPTGTSIPEITYSEPLEITQISDYHWEIEADGSDEIKIVFHSPENDGGIPYAYGSACWYDPPLDSPDCFNNTIYWSESADINNNITFYIQTNGFCGKLDVFIDYLTYELIMTNAEGLFYDDNT